jgi:hypothetical protein
MVLVLVLLVLELELLVLALELLVLALELLVPLLVMPYHHLLYNLHNQQQRYLNFYYHMNHIIQQRKFHLLN